MGTKYVSGRVKELKVGITNYSESKESLSVIGIVSATKYYGDGSNLTGAQIPGVDPSGSSTFNNLNVTGVSTFSSDVRVSGMLTVGASSLTFDGDNDIINVGTGLTLSSVNGIYAVAGLNISGISTFGDYVGLSTGLTVAGVTTFNQDVQFKGAAYNALWDQATSKLKFYDLTQATFGDGNDLQVYSDGTNGIIKGNDKTKITGILTAATANVTGTLTAGLIDGGSF